MSSTHGSPAKRPLQELRQKSLYHRSGHSSDSNSSASPSPSPKRPSPSPRAIKITAAFEQVHNLSIPLQTALSKTSFEATFATRNRVQEFQGAVTNLFNELRQLPNDVLPTPALISAIQGCSFEVHCFGSSAEIFRTEVGFEGYEERQKELGVMLKEATSSICILLELVAQAIEDAETERKRLAASAESDTATTEDRRLSWLVPANAHNRGFDPLVSSSTKSHMFFSAPILNRRNLNLSPSLPNFLRTSRRRTLGNHPLHVANGLFLQPLKNPNFYGKNLLFRQNVQAKENTTSNS